MSDQAARVAAAGAALQESLAALVGWLKEEA
jgi:hypothetical protein